MNIIESWGGLEYVTIKTKKNAIPLKAVLEIEKDIAVRIIRERPIRGKELSFLKKQLKLSCAKLSVEISGHLSSSTIAKIEQKGEQRLSPVNEVYFRLFFAERLGVEVSTKKESFIPDETNSNIEIAA